MKENKIDFWYIVRVLTTAPLMALFTVFSLWGQRRDSFAGVGQLIYDALCLGILPLMAYPTQKYFPHFKNEGRDGQRYLAMLYAVAGYVLCVMLHGICGASKGQWLLCLEYLLSGLVILLFNKAFHKKISGHACGIVGPMLILAYHGISWAIPVGLLLLLIVSIASLKTGRHTALQLLGGSLAPLAVYVFLFCLL